MFSAKHETWIMQKNIYEFHIICSVPDKIHPLFIQTFVFIYVELYNKQIILQLYLQCGSYCTRPYCIESRIELDAFGVSSNTTFNTIRTSTILSRIVHNTVK